MKKILPSIKSNYSEWYIDTLKKAEICDIASKDGVAVIKPHGYAIWERISKLIQNKLSSFSYENYYFPTLIHRKIFEIEKEHVDGMADEVYTTGDYILRPTSESIISYYLSTQDYSYKELPIRLNQWCNVFRKELRQRALLRSHEFLWHEAHSIHVNKEELLKEIEIARSKIYAPVIRNELCIFTYTGEKTRKERFNGALATYTEEAFSRESRAIQIATVHDLSQKFSNVFGINYNNVDGHKELTYQMCFGASTRLLGAVVAVHGDEYGLRLPSTISPYECVIIQLSFDEKTEAYIQNIVKVFQKRKIRFHVDRRTHVRNAAKLIAWEIKGIPMQLRIGEIESNEERITLYRRLINKKFALKFAELENNIYALLEEDNRQLYLESKNRLLTETIQIDQELLLSKIKSKEQSKEKQIFEIKREAYTEELEELIKEHAYSVRCLREESFIVARSY
jgi:prolyl-tRNA synthetase